MVATGGAVDMRRPARRTPCLPGSEPVAIQEPVTEATEVLSAAALRKVAPSGRASRD